MKIRNFIKLLMFCLFSFILWNCTPTVYKFYKETSLPSNAKAIFKNAPGNLSKQMALIEFDGIRNKEKNWNRYGNKMNGNFQIEMLPGIHTVVVALSGSAGQSIKIEFKAEAGKTYFLKQDVNAIKGSRRTVGNLVSNDYNVKVWIEE